MAKLSFRNKILWGTTGLTVSFGLVVILVIYISLLQKLTIELQKRGLFIAEHIAGQTVNPILTDDALNLQIILNDFKSSEKDIEYFFILDTKGKVLAHTFEEGFPADLKETNILKPGQAYNLQHITTEEGHILDIAVPLLKGSIGVFHLGISEKAIRESVNSTVRGIIYIIIAILFIGGSTTVIFSTTITKPLSNLIKTAEEIGKGNLEQTVSVKAKGEIGLLQSAFNKMIRDLNKSREDITSAKNYADNIIRSMNESLIVVSTNGIIQNVNKAACNLLQYDEKELLGQPLGMLSKDEFLLNGSEATAEKTFLSRDGRKISVLFSSSAMRDDNKIHGIVCVAKDITERKQAEEELKTSEMFYRELTSVLGDSLNELKKKEQTLIKGRDAFLNMLEDISESYKELEDLFIRLVIVMVNALDAKSPWTKGHSERVTNYALEIAGEMGAKDEDIEQLRLCGLLHDIGKIGIYDDVLDKPGKLTDKEFELVKMHPAKGAEILKPIKQLNKILPGILYHHERYDGKGYPEGLMGEDIPLCARILCIADSYDSMTADRPYRPAPGEEYAISELKRCSGTQFDPLIVKAFLKVLSKHTDNLN